MENSNRLTLVFNYKQASNYAFNVLIGALDTYVHSPDLAIKIAHTSDQVLAEARDALDQHRKVIVAWSFYSPQFLERAEELAQVKEQLQSENVLHIAGGVHATADPRQTLEAGFDVVAVGE